MPTVGITGHRELPEQTTVLVDQALRTEVTRHPADNLVGISCIADGADSLFAQAILDHGGKLEVIVPADDYRAGLPIEHHRTYDRLLSSATAAHRLPFRASTSEAHMVASELMLDMVDELLAVWDGQPARGYGGTADVVDAAHKRQIPVKVIWPQGARRD